LYRLTGSLLPCVGLHALNNALALGISLEWDWWVVLLVALIAPLGLIAALWPLVSPRRLRLAPVASQSPQPAP
jgi:hypothetical protein